MKLKKKAIYYIAGLAIALVTMIPPVPTALEYLLALIPILFFGADLTMKYMQEFYSKNFVNVYLTGIIAGLGLIVTGRLVYAAMTMIFFSAADHFYDKLLKRASERIEESAKINVRFAKAYKNGKVTRVSANEIQPEHILVLEQGDIVPCDCSAVNGEAVLDYTNVFGAGNVRNVKAGSPCFSGGIVQAGKLAVKAIKPVKDSLASLIAYRTKKAQEPSSAQKKAMGFSRIFERVFYFISLVFFIILLIATKDFKLAVNQATVLLCASAVTGFAETLPVLTLTALLSGRRRGVIFKDTKALEQSGKLRTVSPNEPVSKEVLAKIEETKAVPAKGGYTKEDAVLYRNKTALEADPNPSFKLALGFFSPKAQATALDSKPERIAGAIRTGRHYRSVFRQNIVYSLIGKLTLIALLFILNVSPVAAIVIEFITWAVCLTNATREI